MKYLFRIFYVLFFYGFMVPFTISLTTVLNIFIIIWDLNFKNIIPYQKINGDNCFWSKTEEWECYMQNHLKEVVTKMYYKNAWDFLIGKVSTRKFDSDRNIIEER
jgi:hypothetical protein